MKTIKITDGTTVLEYKIEDTHISVDCTIEGEFYQTYKYSMQETVDDIAYRMSHEWREVQ